METIMLDNYAADPDKLMNPVVLAGENFRSMERRGARMFNRAPRRPQSDAPYEDLDDPSHPSHVRKIVSYDDI
jgi:hypothetical protein